MKYVIYICLLINILVGYVSCYQHYTVQKRTFGHGLPIFGSFGGGLKPLGLGLKPSIGGFDLSEIFSKPSPPIDLPEIPTIDLPEVETEAPAPETEAPAPETEAPATPPPPPPPRPEAPAPPPLVPTTYSLKALIPITLSAMYSLPAPAPAPAPAPPPPVPPTEAPAPAPAPEPETEAPAPAPATKSIIIIKQIVPVGVPLVRPAPQISPPLVIHKIIHPSLLNLLHH